MIIKRVAGLIDRSGFKFPGRDGSPTTNCFRFAKLAGKRGVRCLSEHIFLTAAAALLLLLRELRERWRIVRVTAVAALHREGPVERSWLRSSTIGKTDELASNWQCKMLIMHAVQCRSNNKNCNSS